MLEDQFLGMDHVFDRRPRVSRSVRLAGRGIDRRWCRRAEARAWKIHAYDKESLEIMSFVVAAPPIRPPRPVFIGACVLAGGVCACRQRVADEDGVRSIGV